MKLRFLYLVIGLLVGGLLFVDSRPRAIFDLRRCTNCLHPNEITGMVVAAGLPHAKEWLPFVEIETDTAIIFRHPFTKNVRHFVGFPKKDVKNVGDLVTEDMPYMEGLFEALSVVINKYEMKSYKVYSNGPDFQSVGYLHFHLAES